MNRIKILMIIIFTMIVNIELVAQNQCFMRSTPEDIQYIPHFSNNEFLDELREILFPETLIRAKTDVLAGNNGVMFNIPCKVNIFSNDDGSQQALTKEQVLKVMNETNMLFAANNTNIHFYLICEPEIINSTYYNHVEDDTKRDALNDAYHVPYLMVLNYVYEITGDAAGWGRYPWTDDNFILMLETGGNIDSDNWETKATVHELGHCLGLYHTQETRDPNADVNQDATDCYQESVDRGKTQPIACLSTYGEKKCEVNGDYFCDTDASPGTLHVVSASDCSYDGGGTDNWSVAWTPPTTNFMSYINQFGYCANIFSAGQITQMHAMIIAHMEDDIVVNRKYYNMNYFLVDGSESNGDYFELYSPEIIHAASGVNLYDIYSGATVYLQAGTEINIYPGFSSYSGSNFTAKVESIINCSKPLRHSDEIDEEEFKVYTNLTDIQIKQAKELIKSALVKVNTKYSSLINTSNSSIVWDIQLYPNPSSDVANLKYNFGRYEGAVTYTIIDAAGTIVNQSSFTVMQQAGVHSISLAGLSSGVYFLSVSANGRNKNLRLTVIK